MAGLRAIVYYRQSAQPAGSGSLRRLHQKTRSPASPRPQTDSRGRQHSPQSGDVRRKVVLFHDAARPDPGHQFILGGEPFVPTHGVSSKSNARDPSSTGAPSNRSCRSAGMRRNEPKPNVSEPPMIAGSPQFAFACRRSSMTSPIFASPVGRPSRRLQKCFTTNFGPRQRLFWPCRSTLLPQTAPAKDRVSRQNQKRIGL